MNVPNLACMAFALASLAGAQHIITSQPVTGPIDSIATPVLAMQLPSGGVSGTTGTMPVYAASTVDPTAPVMSAKWEVDGFEYSVSTPRRVGESSTNQAKRHQAAVRALAGVVGWPESTGSTTTSKAEWSAPLRLAT